MPLLRLDKASLHFGTQVLLDEVDLVITRGEKLGLLGRNGTGKTTLLKVLAGELSPDSGERWLRPGIKLARLEQTLPDADELTVFDVVAAGLSGAGELVAEYHRLVHDTTNTNLDTLARVQQKLEDVDGWTLQQRVETIISQLQLPADKVVSQLGITHVPEGRRLFGNLSVMENLQLATFARKDRDNVKKDIRRVFDIFPRLEERKSQASGTMSGGEQQMLAIGRAFMSGRRLMLLDEPSMGLSPLLMMNVFQALKEINRQEGTAILLVEQNARLALKFSQKGYVLENGNLVLEGNSETLINDPEVMKAYLGG